MAVYEILEDGTPRKIAGGNNPKSNLILDYKLDANSNNITITKDFPVGVYEIYMTGTGSGFDQRLYINNDRVNKCRESILASYNTSTPTCTSTVGTQGIYAGMIQLTCSVLRLTMIVDNEEVFVDCREVAYDGTTYRRDTIGSIPFITSVTSLVFEAQGGTYNAGVKIKIFKTA